VTTENEGPVHEAESEAEDVGPVSEDVTQKEDTDEEEEEEEEEEKTVSQGTPSAEDEAQEDEEISQEAVWRESPRSFASNQCVATLCGLSALVGNRN
jgi:hypothetical protein